MKTFNTALTVLAAIAALSGPAMAQSKPGMGAPATQPGMAPGATTVDLEVCNRSGRQASVAVSYVQVGESAFMNRGWYTVNDGECQTLVTTDNSNFYFYADALDGSGRYWQGDHNLCVQYPGPYTFYSTGADECDYGQEVKPFLAAHADEPGKWTWTLNP